MQRLFERLLLLKAGTDEIHQRIVTKRPEKFLKIHRIHLEVAFLGGNGDVLDVFLDGHEQAGFNIVVSSVR